MTTKILMTCSAIFLFGLGLLFTFAPAELLAYAGGAQQATLALVFQATGALYLGWGILNWMAKDNLLGGIFGRPVALGNFLHFVVFAIALVRAFAASHGDIRLGMFALIYSVFAAWFGLVTFGGPPKAPSL